jgi:hypothetical protein
MHQLNVIYYLDKMLTMPIAALLQSFLFYLFNFQQKVDFVMNIVKRSYSIPSF